jgi:hypothetical protein
MKKAMTKTVYLILLCFVASLTARGQNTLDSSSNEQAKYRKVIFSVNLKNSSYHYMYDNLKEYPCNVFYRSKVSGWYYVTTLWRIEGPIEINVPIETDSLMFQKRAYWCHSVAITSSKSDTNLGVVNLMPSWNGVADVYSLNRKNKQFRVSWNMPRAIHECIPIDQISYEGPNSPPHIPYYSTECEEIFFYLRCLDFGMFPRKYFRTSDTLLINFLPISNFPNCMYNDLCTMQIDTVIGCKQKYQTHLQNLIDQSCPRSRSFPNDLDLYKKEELVDCLEGGFSIMIIQE